MNKSEFLIKWCSPDSALEVVADFEKMELHYWEFSKDKPCNCQTCDPKPIFETDI